jgi:uncharacterized cupredoxin-like copper-binding protein
MSLRGRTLVALATIVMVVPLPLMGCGTAPIRLQVDIRFSHYEPTELSVPAGRPVEITLINHDPIDHEWIVGDDAIHERHRTGTEPVHDARPTEVSLPALGKRTTTVTFPTAGRLKFICHLPGHEAYGMVGILYVTA